MLAPMIQQRTKLALHVVERAALRGASDLVTTGLFAANFVESVKEDLTERAAIYSFTTTLARLKSNRIEVEIEMLACLFKKA